MAEAGGRPPTLVVTGASGFVGRRLLAMSRERYRVIAIDRRAPHRDGADAHPNVVWHQLDLAEPEPLGRVFADLAAAGGADALIHLAAYYDFTGEDHPEYQRTNVDALRNVLELAPSLALRRFIFASSVAACDFPPPGHALDESSPPDGDHRYAETKRIGEQMLRRHADRVPSCIVRFAAMYSDWCEHPPLYVFLETWLSRRWNARILGGRGASAVPYLHVRDAMMMLGSVLERMDELAPCEVLCASPDGATSHRQLFAAATAYHFGRTVRPLAVPRWLAGAGIRLRDALGRLAGERPFERPWMARYIDKALTVDSQRTRRRLGWAPRPRLEILRRLPFLLENRSSDPVEWQRRNQEALEVKTMRPNLRIYRLLETHEQEISDAFTRELTAPEARARIPHYGRVSQQDHQWHHRLILRNLMQAIRTRQKGVFMSYCRDLAEHRFAQGYSLDELAYALRTLMRVIDERLAGELEAAGLSEGDLHDYVTTTLQFGLDQAEEVFEIRQPGYLPALTFANGLHHPAGEERKP